MHSCGYRKSRPQGSLRRHFGLAAGVLVLLNLIIQLAPADVLAGSAKGPVLFGPADAGKLRMTNEEWGHVARSRSLSTGPIIAVEKPKVDDIDGVPTIATDTPTDLLVVFKQRTAPVDMNSLDVEARKGWFSKSLTDMVRPYVKGNTLDVPGLKSPRASSSWISRSPMRTATRPTRIIASISMGNEAGLRLAGSGAHRIDSGRSLPLSTCCYGFAGAP